MNKIFYNILDKKVIVIMDNTLYYTNIPKRKIKIAISLIH